MTLDDLDIQINYKKLTIAQKMVIHTAIQNLAMDLRNGSLGDDKFGKKMAESYLETISELNKIIQVGN